MQAAVSACPLCGTELSTVKFHEIQAKLKRSDEVKAVELEHKIAEAEVALRRGFELRLQSEVDTQRSAAVKAAEQQAAKQIADLMAARDEAFRKAKAAEAREIAVKKQAELDKETAAKLVQQRFEIEIKKLTTERDAAHERVKESGRRELEIRHEVAEQAAARQQKELANQRAALEKDKNNSLLRQQAEFNRERESLQQKVHKMEHQLQKKTANELGDGAEIDIFEALRDEFQGDRITRVKKGQPGGDILHEVLHKGEVCGKILFDSKARQAWQNSYVTKLRQDQVDAGAEHSVLATSVFPAGQKEMCIESDVIVVHPARLVYITRILRDAMVRMHVRGLSMKERAGKMTQLYSLITSEAYGKKFMQAGKLAQDILELDVQEKKTHDNVWRKRGTLAIQIRQVLREVETDIAAIIERDDDGDAGDDARLRMRVSPTTVKESKETIA